MEISRELINEVAEGALLIDGFDNCIVGITEEFGGIVRILYSTKKIVETLMVNSEMSEEDAFEYFNYNIYGAYMGEQTPIYLMDYLDL
jgi:hypothetical protein